MTPRLLGARSGALLAAALLLPLMVTPGPSAAATATRCVVVNASRPMATYPTLQSAVNAARAGDTIHVRGTCVGTTVIDKTLNVTGVSKSRSGRPTLDGGGNGPVVTVAAGAAVVLTRVTVTNGRAVNGAGLYNHGTLSLVRSTVTRNAATGSGGGISNESPSDEVGAPDATVTLVRSLVTGNTAGVDGGGILSVRDGVTLRDTTIAGNVAGRDGGGLMSSTDHSDLTVDGSSDISRNRAGRHGGGIWQGTHARMTLNDSASVHHNEAGSQGGGIYCGDCSSDLNDASTVHHNTAVEGGGAYVANGRMAFSDDSSVFANSATDGGGLFLWAGGVGLQDASTIRNNSATRHGGGAAGDAVPSITLDDTSSIRYNRAGLAGGGIYNVWATLNGTSTIRDNRPDNCYSTFGGCPI
jgi:predicted outer membrane repeat protein